MAIENGITATLSVDDAADSSQDISSDVTSFDYTMPMNLQDVAVLSDSAQRRIQLLADFTCTINGVFNDAANKSHDVFKTILSSSQVRGISFAVSGQTLTAEVLFTDYPLSRSASGELTFAVPGSNADGSAPAWA